MAKKKPEATKVVKSNRENIEKLAERIGRLEFQAQCGREGHQFVPKPESHGGLVSWMSFYATPAQGGPRIEFKCKICGAVKFVPKKDLSWWAKRRLRIVGIIE